MEAEMEGTEVSLLFCVCFFVRKLRAVEQLAVTSLSIRLVPVAVNVK
jgi:hypothetical protein